MMGYGGEMYAPYEGEAWSWGGQPWGSGYEQVQYDCSGTWETYQQTSWEAPQATAPAPPGPKVGAELLTELRLAELKRLIDRDARALKASATEVMEIESSDSAECTTRAPDSNEDTPTKDDAASSAHSAPQVSEAPKAEDFAVEDGESSMPSRAKSSGRAKVMKRAGEDKEASQVYPSTPAAPAAASAAPPPPGLDAPDEQCFIAIADFTPESRNYGEMPVRKWEEIYVSGEPLDGWIFGMKRYHGHEDEGWIPASALHLDEHLEFELDGSALRARNLDSQSSGGALRRGRAQQQSSAGGGRKGGAAPQQQRGTASQQGRKGGSRIDHDHGLKGGKGDDQPWHQHGNWWSRQRHLKSEGKDADYHASGNGSGSRKGPSRPVPPPPPPAASSDEEPETRQSGRRGRGHRAAGGRGAGVVAAPRHEAERRPERPKRERPSLTSMLDRLNKPLVVPKSSS